MNNKKQQATSLAVSQIFERTEKKYYISSSQQQALFALIGDYFQEDSFGRSTICNIYYDTDNYQLIRDSIEKPLYKEKLRLRSYGVPDIDSTVFLELKKKYKGIVYKRREKMTLAQAEAYLSQGVRPFDTQIIKEMDYFLHFYQSIQPAAYISYERDAYYCKTDHNLRITFDQNLLFRKDALSLQSGVFGTSLLEDGMFIMEIKALFSMPMWLTNALNELQIYPSSFSKYGRAYQKYIATEEFYV